VTDAKTFTLEIFRRSVLKQAKWNALRRATGPVGHREALDLGSDNGVISYLFRESGGSWRSADLDPGAVASIRALVGDPVEQLDGATLPYADASFDLVVVVDLMEHLDDDVRFAFELARVLRPGGRLVVNVPRRTRFSPLRALRLGLGLSDEDHGHVRPGYSADGLRTTCGPRFQEWSFRTYVGPCSDLIDIALSCAMKGAGGGSPKGAMVTIADAPRLEKRLRLYRLVYPLLKVFSLLDGLFFWLPGHMLIGTATRVSDEE